MNRKLWGITLLGAWKGFPLCQSRERNCKGVRNESTSAAERARERCVEVHGGLTLCQSPGYSQAQDYPGLEEGELSTLAMSNILCPQEPDLGQSSLSSSWD